MECLLKHTEENIEKQKELGVKQGVKSAMAWKVSKMKPRSPNGYLLLFFFIFPYCFLCDVLATFHDYYYLISVMSADIFVLHFRKLFCSC